MPPDPPGDLDEIVRHRLVRGDASPDDPAQAGYWAERRAKNKPLLDRRTLHLLRRQHGSCPICGESLLHADREPQTPPATRTLVGSDHSGH